MIVINEAIQPTGGDQKNYWLFYAGPGYPSRKEVEKFAKDKGCTGIYFGTDEGTEFEGFYNGDTWIIYKDANKLPKGFKEDAKKHGEKL